MAKKRSVRRSAEIVKGELSVFAFGHALGIVNVIVMLFYAIMTWLGDYNPIVIAAQFPLEFSFSDWTLIIGLVETYVISYIGGWIFAKIYNKFK